MKMLFQSFKMLTTKFIKIIPYLLIVILLFLLVSAHQIHINISKTTSNPYSLIKPSQTLSVAVNERNELIIFDRSTGTYQVYADTIGTSIFKLYATGLYQTYYKHATDKDQ